MENSSENTRARAMTKTEMAAAYGVCPRTFNKWIKPFRNEIGTIDGTNILTPAQVKTIFEKIGEP
jgi:transposase-like protein